MNARGSVSRITGAIMSCTGTREILMQNLTTLTDAASNEVFFRLLHDLFVPRPVFLIGTISHGISNLAPFSYINAASTRPPCVMFSILQKDDGSDKDTLRNLRETQQFTVNAVTSRIIEQANACGAALPRECSEFAECKLTPVASTCILAPRVLESPVQLECSVLHLIPVTDSAEPGSATVCIGRVLAAHIANDFYLGDGALDVEQLALIGRCSVDRYLVADKFFQLDRPETGDSGI